MEKDENRSSEANDAGQQPAAGQGGPDDPTFIPGDLTTLLEIPRVLGIYRLKRQLGRGGMGEVWLAFDTTLERDVAVKLMRKELLANDEAVRRFMREARAVARLNHPNIVQVYSFGDQTGLLYFVMELVEGETLADRIRTAGKLSLEETVPFMLQTIEGLSYANARGIVHRDIKPSNLMITPENRVKIADFGLAKMVEHDSQMTAAGATMGSPNYMSPEQARGNEADHRSDIYALGISFYQALTGELPFVAQSPLSVLLRQIQDPLPIHPAIGELADGMALNVLMKMTDKDPEKRYQNYGELATGMAQLMPNHRFHGSHFVTGTMPVTSPGAAARTLTPPSNKMNGVAQLPPIPPPPGGAGVPALPRGGSGENPPGAASLPTEDASSKKIKIMMVGAAVIMAIACVVSYVGYLRFARAVKAETEDTELASRQENAFPGSAPMQVGGADGVATPGPSAAGGTPAMTPGSGSPSPVATPYATSAAVSPPTVPTASVAVAPSPAGGKSPVASPSPAPSPSAIVSALAVPSPTPQQVVTADHVIIGSAQDAPGIPVPVGNRDGRQIGTLPAGTQVPLIRSETAGGKTAYVVAFGGGEGYVDFDRARMAMKGSPMASALSGHATPAAEAAAQIFVLGTEGAGPNEMVPVFLDEKARIEFRRVPAGTQVYLVEEEANTYKVALPGGKQVYIFKKMASAKK
jgi:serine/threonine protein kinase